MSDNFRGCGGYERDSESRHQYRAIRRRHTRCHLPVDNNDNYHRVHLQSRCVYRLLKYLLCSAIRILLDYLQWRVPNHRCQFILANRGTSVTVRTVATFFSCTFTSLSMTTPLDGPAVYVTSCGNSAGSITFNATGFSCASDSSMTLDVSIQELWTVGLYQVSFANCISNCTNSCEDVGLASISSKDSSPSVSFERVSVTNYQLFGSGDSSYAISVEVPGNITITNTTFHNNTISYTSSDEKPHRRRGLGRTVSCIPRLIPKDRETICSRSWHQ
eukprot:TRINITY_DN13161_c0_g1_i1.p1 TRINITY_DN13161_c0_g1~~TRINITY_DN13161_c0_g1_i1.p1  ORF type:complete len:274 (-),score=-14.05 TRINITY_DN13161_c0_g1_i1:498-1319(-)